jgi:hypothetical protein
MRVAGQILQHIPRPAEWLLRISSLSRLHTAGVGRIEGSASSLADKHIEYRLARSLLPTVEELESELDQRQKPDRPLQCLKTDST